KAMLQQCEEDTPGFGQRMTVKLSRTGDLLGAMELRARLPPVKLAVCAGLFTSWQQCLAAIVRGEFEWSVEVILKDSDGLQPLLIILVLTLMLTLAVLWMMLMLTLTSIGTAICSFLLS